MLSAAAGFVGMQISVRANVRTAKQPKRFGPGLNASFPGRDRDGIVRSWPFGLLSVTAFYAVTKDLSALVGLAFGSSLISVFARLGGGIFY